MVLVVIRTPTALLQTLAAQEAADNAITRQVLLELLGKATAEDPEPLQAAAAGERAQAETTTQAT